MNRITGHGTLCDGWTCSHAGPCPEGPGGWWRVAEPCPMFPGLVGTVHVTICLLRHLWVVRGSCKRKRFEPSDFCVDVNFLFFELDAYECKCGSRGICCCIVEKCPAAFQSGCTTPPAT